MVEASTRSPVSVSVVSAGSFEHSTGMVVVVGAEVVVDVVLVVLAANVVVGATVSWPPSPPDHVTTKSAAPTIMIKVKSMMTS